MKAYFTAKRIAFLAVFTALIMVTTMYLSVPNGLGYTNLGDTFIMLGAALFGPLFAMISGGIGSMLGDILLGFTVYAPFTLVVKGLEGFLAGGIAKSLVKVGLNRHAALIVGFIVAALEMIFGYFLTNAALNKSLITGFTDVPSDCIQGAISVTAAYLLTFVLSRVHALRTLTDNLLFTPIRKNNTPHDTEDDTHENYTH